ncbi:MAG: hypothetical protein R3B96_19635 [Pirellulaceae bacterium]
MAGRSNGSSPSTHGAGCMTLLPSISPVEGQNLVARLLEHTGHALPAADALTRLQVIARAFSHLPYENLSKAVAFDRSAASEFETPRQVIENHLQLGSGGTCFSLTHTLVCLLQSLGIDAWPILADRSYGPDTHSAVLVALPAEPPRHETATTWIVDPGFLIHDPLRLNTGLVTTLVTPIQVIELVPIAADRWQLFTATESPRPSPRGGEGQAPARSQPPTYRLTYRATPASPEEFGRAWRASFGWEMMRYPVVSMATTREQVFACGKRWQVRSAEGLERIEVDRATWRARLVQQFGLSPALVDAAWEAFEEKPQ